MRSEKEIRERVKGLEEWEKGNNEGEYCLTHNKDYDKPKKCNRGCSIVCCYHTEVNENEGAQVALEWILKGEPRYSSIELEKLVSYYANLCPSKEASAVESFGKFLQDKTRVEKILDEK